MISNLTDLLAVKIPLVVSGTAENKIDYNVSFNSLGEKIFYSNAGTDYTGMVLHSDGRVIGVGNGGWIWVHELDGSVTQNNLPYGLDSMEIAGDYLYFIADNQQKIIRYSLLDSSYETLWELTGNKDFREIEVVNNTVYAMYMNYESSNAMTFAYLNEENNPVILGVHPGYPGLYLELITKKGMVHS